MTEQIPRIPYIYIYIYIKIQAGQWGPRGKQITNSKPINLCYFHWWSQGHFMRSVVFLRAGMIMERRIVLRKIMSMCTYRHMTKQQQSAHRFWPASVARCFFSYSAAGFPALFEPMKRTKCSRNFEFWFCVCLPCDSEFGPIRVPFWSIFRGGAHLRAPPGTPKGPGVDFSSILDRFWGARGHPWGPFGPTFRAWGRPGARPGGQKVRKNGDGALRASAARF